MEKRKIRVIALDLDDTLLNRSKQITEENYRALERAAAAGAEIVPATGRFFASIPQVVRELPFVRYAIVINGAQIFDARTGTVLAEQSIPCARAAELMEHMARLPVLYDCYMDNEGWIPTSHRARAGEFALTSHVRAMLESLQAPAEDLIGWVRARGHDVQKVSMFYRDPDARLEALATLPAQYPDMAVVTSIPNNIELTNRLATKGQALTMLCQTLGVPIDQSMAFGDDLNDCSMIKAAGIGVAMGNAKPELQSVADYVTRDCDESGVAAAIERFCLL